MVLNIAGVVLFLPFIPLVEKMLDRLLPEKRKPAAELTSV